MLKKLKSKITPYLVKVCCTEKVIRKEMPIQILQINNTAVILVPREIRQTFAFLLNEMNILIIYLVLVHALNKQMSNFEFFTKNVKFTDNFLSKQAQRKEKEMEEQETYTHFHRFIYNIGLISQLAANSALSNFLYSSSGICEVHR